MTTYHVRHRYGFVGDYDDTDIIVIDCQDAVIYARSGAETVADELNRHLGDSDRRAEAVMLTSAGKVRRLRAGLGA